MSDIKKSVTLRPGRMSKTYHVVIKTTNTIEPRIGAELSDAEVQHLINEGVQVTILEDK